MLNQIGFGLMILQLLVCAGHSNIKYSFKMKMALYILLFLMTLLMMSRDTLSGSKEISELSLFYWGQNLPPSISQCIFVPILFDRQFPENISKNFNFEYFNHFNFKICISIISQ